MRYEVVQMPQTIKFPLYIPGTPPGTQIIQHFSACHHHQPNTFGTKVFNSSGSSGRQLFRGSCCQTGEHCSQTITIISWSNSSLTVGLFQLHRTYTSCLVITYSFRFKLILMCKHILTSSCPGTLLLESLEPLFILLF